MAESPLRRVLQHFRMSLRRQDEASLSDAHLLKQFIEKNDETAFAVLTRRHGPMVMGVCLRITRNRQDAEDAFQATFLVLARKAASVTPQKPLGNWLYGVAHKTSLKAREAAYKRRLKEKQVPAMPERAVADQKTWSDLLPVLDHELIRLPDKFRIPIVLCDLEGKTRQEAAKQLGCPEGSLSSQLSRARALLGKRMARHGLTLSAGSLAAALAQNTASACVPMRVVLKTIQGATLVVSGQATNGVISYQVAALTEGMLKTMLLTKLKVAMVVIFLAVPTCYGVGLLAHGVFAGGQTQPESAKEPNANARQPITRGSQPKTVTEKQDQELLQGVWNLGADDLSMKWNRVEPSSRNAVLDMLVKKLQGNYERIRTWKGKYSLQQSEAVSGAFVAEVEKYGAPNGPKKLNSWFDMQFVLDMKTGAIYRSIENSVLKWYSEESKQFSPVANGKGNNERSVVTAEQYLHFDSKNVVPELSVLPGNPKAMGKRVGFIDTKRFADGLSEGDLPDPRKFCKLGGGPMAWVPLMELRGLADGDGPFKLHQSAGPKGTWFRLAIAMGDGSHVSIVFDPEQGFCPVSYLHSKEESGRKPWVSERWKWKKYNDIYVPAEVEYWLFGQDNKACIRYRKALLDQCEMNSPVNPRQFSYQALGMKDGDVVVDNISKQVLVINNGDGEKLANFRDMR